MPKTKSNLSLGLDLAGQTLVLVSAALCALRALGIQPFTQCSWWSLTAPVWLPLAVLMAAGFLVGLSRLQRPNVD